MGGVVLAFEVGLRAFAWEGWVEVEGDFCWEGCREGMSTEEEEDGEEGCEVVLLGHF